MAISRRNRRFMSQAAAQALVRFGPELSGLRELQRTAESNLRLGVHQAQATSRGIEAAVGAARPQLGKVYDQAGLDQARVAHTLIGTDLASLGPSADRFKAAGATEAAASANRLNEAKTNALTDLTSRGVRASEGEQFQVEQARRQFVSDLTSILQRKQDLRKEKGAFTASTIDQLAQDSANRQVKKDIAAAGNATTLAAKGVDANGNPLPGRHPDGRPRSPRAGAPKLSNGVKLQPQSAHNTLAGKISTARDATTEFVKASMKAGKGRGWINNALSKGIPGYTVHDPSTGRLKINKDGSPVTQPGLKAIPEIERNVILDQIMYGGVTTVTARKLNSMGYLAKHLSGVHRLTPAEERKLHQRLQQGHSAQQAGTIVGALLHGLNIGG